MVTLTCRNRLVTENQSHRKTQQKHVQYGYIDKNTSSTDWKPLIKHKTAKIQIIHIQFIVSPRTSQQLHKLRLGGVRCRLLPVSQTAAEIPQIQT